LGPHPDFKVGDPCTQILAHRATLLGAPAIDRPLDLEQGIHATDGLQRPGRDRCLRLAFSLATRNWLRYRRARRMAGVHGPAGRFQDWPWLLLGGTELTVTA
jgi:hypothetical protein